MSPAERPVETDLMREANQSWNAAIEQGLHVFRLYTVIGMLAAVVVGEAAIIAALLIDTSPEPGLVGGLTVIERQDP